MSRENSTVANSGRNYSIAVTATPQVVSSNGETISFDRTTLEVYNAGSKTIYLWFAGSDHDNARPILPGTSISYAITEYVVVYVACTGVETSTAICTELA